MNTSIFLAKAFALYFLFAGIGMFFNKTYYQKAAMEMVENAGLALLTAIFTLILGIILVLFHNIWPANWPVVITLLCWITLIKGALRLMFPVQAKSWVSIIENNKFYYITTMLMILLGIYLAYLGFRV